jgi:hypothetical protein
MSSHTRRQPSREIDKPEPGLFSMRLVKGGPPVAAEIAAKLGALTATINGQPADVEHVWTSGTFIDRATFDRLNANRPADPMKPVDFRAMGHVASVPAEGSNRPVMDLAAALAPDALAAWLEHEYAEHEARCAELAAAYDRFLVATASGIHDDDVTGRATDFAKVHKAELAAIDATRTRIKAPVLHAQRLIDGAGKKLTDPLKANTAEIEARIAVYLTAKAETARRAAEKEAQRLAALAQEAMRDAEPEEAITALRDAQHAEALATAPTPDLTRTRSLSGAMAGLRDNFVWALEDITKVPTAYLQINDSVVKAAIKSGVRNIPGIRIWNDGRVVIR